MQIKFVRYKKAEINNELFLSVRVVYEEGIFDYLHEYISKTENIAKDSIKLLAEARWGNDISYMFNLDV